MNYINNKLSVALATYNEETNLARCLESIKEISSEIIIVDGISSDKTVEIAKQFGAKITVTDNPPIFHINKQKALDLCRNEWILQLDADEVVSPKLAEEIKKIISMDQNEINNYKFKSLDNKLFFRHQQLLEIRDGNYGTDNGDIVAFFISRKNNFLGKFLRYGGTYPDGVIRLVKNGKAQFPCKSVHEQIKIDGRVGWLENCILHYDSPTLSRYRMRAGRYISLKINELKMDKVKINISSFFYYLLYKPLSVFTLMTFRHKGILDGWQGIAFAFFSGLHYPIAYIKYLKNKND